MEQQRQASPPGQPPNAPKRRLAAWAAGLLACLACGAPEHPEILVIVNGESPISEAIGRSFAQSRNVPAENWLSLSVPLSDPSLRSADHEAIDREGFERHVRQPVEAFLQERDPGGRIRILVTAKGVPLKITEDRPPTATWLRDARGAAVDAELSLLFSEQVGSPGVAETPNPFFDSELSFEEFRRRNPDSPLRYLVARLTGYADDGEPAQGEEGTAVPASVASLLERASSRRSRSERARYLVDLSGSESSGKWSGELALLGPAAETLRALGVPLRVDFDAPFVGNAEQILGYASWGSNDGNSPDAPTYGRIDGRLFPGSFGPRAVAVDFVSTNARTFTAPAHYGQSLCADLIALGASAVVGHVDEPTLSGVARPQIFFRSYARGTPAVESFYRSIPFLGWQNVYVGDPLLAVAGADRVPQAGDRDGDGVPDAEDNCTRIPNPKQRDTNGDGFGNLCDGDVNNDGRVTSSWGATWPTHGRGDLEWIVLAQRSDETDPDMDLDGDGTVSERDVALAAISLFQPPGPSGLAHASASR